MVSISVKDFLPSSSSIARYLALRDPTFLKRGMIHGQLQIESLGEFTIGTQVGGFSS
jgi:hypothetical protein